MGKTANNDWRRVREIFEDAVRQPLEDRRRYVRQACGGEEQLLTEVESLLDSHERTDSFLETPAFVQISEETQPHDNQLFPGQSLSHYEITKFIGSGGMGEVYLARDTRLNRNVAIKLLRASFLPDAQAKGRLLREARTAALLEHPNICQIYEISESDEFSFIVMQYLKGPTLAEILSEKRLDTATALDLAIQMAEALAEAHSQGVIHRDIKPANVIVTEKGQAKILDFGLAKFIEAETSADTVQRLNSSGAVMGTVPYMSPEQLRGDAVDARTDIFSFGALVYEMLTGISPFSRESNAETISAILNDDPDWSRIPQTLRPALQKCLAKKRDNRFGSTRDLANELIEVQKTGRFDEPLKNSSTAQNRAADTAEAPTSKIWPHYFWRTAENRSPRSVREIDSEHARGSRWPHPVAAIGVTVILLMSSVAVYLWQWNGLPSEPQNFHDLRPVPLVSWRTSGTGTVSDYRISHDGRMIVFSASKDGGKEAIYIKQTSDGNEIRVTNDNWVNLNPLWSPDNQRIVFVSIREGQYGLYVTPAFGGVVTQLGVSEKSVPAPRHWSRDGGFIFYELLGNLYRLDLATREAAKVTTLPDFPQNDRHFSFSLDETQIAFCDVRDGQRDIWTMPSVGGEPTRLTNDADLEYHPLWHPDGGKRVLYTVSRNYTDQIGLTWADNSRPPVQVTRGTGHYALLDISPDGHRLYFSSNQKMSDVSSIDTESGRESDVAAETDTELWSDVSPDGKAILYHSNASPNPTATICESSLVVKSSAGKTKWLQGKGCHAKWLPDSRRIAILRPSDTAKGEYVAWLIDTVTDNERQMTSEYVLRSSMTIMPIASSDIGSFDVSPDGRRFVYLDVNKPRNVKVLSLETGEAASITSNQNAGVKYFSPLFSPDGARIAIISQEQFQDKTQKSVRRVLVVADGAVKEIYSTTSSIRLIGWSAAGEIVVAVSEKLMLPAPMDVDILSLSLTGTGRKISTIQNGYTRTLTMSPNGRAIGFTARNDDRDDIWRMSIMPGGVPRRITANASSQLLLANLAFAADGKTIYFDKQGETKSISIFEKFN